jgi:uncharacterized membrane protein
MLEVLIIMVIVLFIAFLIETLVEYLFGTIFDKVPALNKFKWLQMYIAMIVGIVAAFLYGLDLLNLLSQFLSEISGATKIIAITPFGLIITGCAIGRGSNYLHDLYDRFFKKFTVDAESTNVINNSGG